MATNPKIKEDTLMNAIADYQETHNKDILTPFIGKVGGFEPFGEFDLGDAINHGDFVLVDELLYKYSNFSELDILGFKSEDKKLARTFFASQISPYTERMVDIVKKYGANKFMTIIRYMYKNPDAKRPGQVDADTWDALKYGFQSFSMTNFADGDTPPTSEYDDDIKTVDQEKKDLTDTKTKREYYETLKKNAQKSSGINGSKKAKADVEKYDWQIKNLNNPKNIQKDTTYLDTKKTAIEDFKKGLEKQTNQQ